MLNIFFSVRLSYIIIGRLNRTNWKNAIISCRVYGKPTYVDFESIKLPVQECVHEYLTQTFGDYMKLPPEKERIGLHALNVDFGDY